MNNKDLLICTKEGIYCPLGDFHIDPWRKVQRAVITHAHSDHARKGSASYLTSKPGEHVLRSRLGNSISMETLAYGEVITMGEVEVSLKPAGHILGSSQVVVTHQGQTWIASGDYKREYVGVDGQPADVTDPTCQPFEPVNCHGLITEATFGLPIYQWPDPMSEIARINDWWRENREAGRLSVIYTYSLGKSQRLLSMLDASIGTFYVHPAVDKLNQAYVASAVALPEWEVLDQKIFEKKLDGEASQLAGGMLISPSATEDTRWFQKIQRGIQVETAMASGWMSVRGGFQKNRQAQLNQNFVISDHADWPGLMQTFEDCNVLKNGGRIGVTHGASEIVAQYLQELGHDAYVLETAYEGEGEGESEGARKGEREVSKTLKGSDA